LFAKLWQFDLDIIKTLFKVPSSLFNANIAQQSLFDRAGASLDEHPLPLKHLAGAYVRGKLEVIGSGSQIPAQCQKKNFWAPLFTHYHLGPHAPLGALSASCPPPHSAGSGWSAPALLFGEINLGAILSQLSHLGNTGAQDGTVQDLKKINSVLQCMHGTLHICGHNVCE